MEAELIRYRAEVEEPAFAMLRDRKASRPPAMRKEPTTSAYYRQVLDGIDPRFPPLTGASAVVNSLTIGMSWPPDDH
ncbi:hypothetical protein E2562_012394 [Oryza meyeriana var. granulata]|nr:hypothetical protein E2562_012394 [Oryza meyeriana var. granulata]